MASRSDDLNVSNFGSLHQQILTQFQGDWVTRLNIEQLFTLVDGVLPFEACLYYQVLPLYLEGNRLHLGMVSPEDTSASDYVRRIISYLNYSLVSHEMPSEALRVILTAYLNHMGNQPIGATRPFSYGHHRHASRQLGSQSANPNERLTLVVDSPEDLVSAEASGEVILSPIAAPPPIDRDNALPVTLPVPDLHDELEPELDFASDLDVSVAPQPSFDPKSISEPGWQPAWQPEWQSTDRLLDQLPDSLSNLLPDQQSDQRPDQRSNPDIGSNPNIGLESTIPTSSDSFKALETLPQSEPALIATSPHPSLSVQPHPVLPKPSLTILTLAAEHLHDPVEQLATLPAQQLIKELLARVLVDGIGRLYFECHASHGRIIWSQNGVLQSVLDHLPLPLFHHLIQELKGMAHIPSVSIEQPQQSEIEYLYDCARVLLRFRFMAGSYGEEATIQVLRGAALKFYQQQQINKLEKDALGIAQQLQNKLHEIRARAYSHPDLREVRSEMMPKLLDLLHRMEQELDALDENP